MSEHDDAVERLLLDHFEGPVPDDGFCERTMLRLPARRRLQTWPLALGSALGGVLCWLSLSSAPLLHIGWRDWLSGEVSAPALVLLATMAGASVLASIWTVAEASSPAPR